MKKVILNQISKAVAGGSNYFYLPLHLVEGKDQKSHYETSVDLSKLFELDSNKVPVIKEICVCDEKGDLYEYMSYGGSKDKDCYKYYSNNPNGNNVLSHDGQVGVVYNDIEVVVDEENN